MLIKKAILLINGWYKKQLKHYMMSIFKNTKIALLLIISAGMILISCNKDLPDPGDIPVITPSGLSLAETIAANPGDSLYYKLIIKAGLVNQFTNKALVYTLFVPDNNAMIVSGLSNAVITSAGFPAAAAAGIVNYNTVGQVLPSNAILSSFPNMQLPTQIGLDPSNPLVRLSTFPSKRGNSLWVNNVPLTAVDQFAANGVIHHTAFVAAPPTKVLAQLIYTDPNLTYFTAAVARGDSGQVGLNRIDSLLKYGVTNMTILPPNNTAFKTLLFGIIYSSLLSQGVPPAIAAATATALSSSPTVFSNPALYAAMPASTVRGIVVYHILASQAFGTFSPNVRAFSVNFAPFPGQFVPTLVNTAFAAHPGIRAVATFTGPFVTNLQFTGLGTFPPGGLPYSGAPATAVSIDNHAVNGVYHTIDKVLLPQ